MGNSNASETQGRFAGAVSSGSVHMHFSSQHMIRAAALVVELVLVALIAFLLAKAVWLFASGATPPLLSISQAPSYALSQSKAPRTDVVGSFDPFYRDNPLLAGTNTSPVQEEELAPETTLDISLFGTRYNLDNARDDMNSAIIKGPGGQQASYRIGDPILDGVTLAAVYPNYVTLSRSGELERLSLDGAEPPKPRASAGKHSPGAAQATRKVAARESARATRQQQVPATLSTDQLSQDDFQNLLDRTSLVPRVNGRQIEGWIMTPKGSNQLFTSLGLKAGDVLKRINGVDLKNAERLTEIFDDIEGASQVNLLIERDGQDQTITFAYDG